MKEFLTIGLLLLSTSVLSQSSEDTRIDAFGKYESAAYREAVVAFNKLLTDNSTNNQQIELFKGISEYKISDYYTAISDLKLSEVKYPESDLWLARTYAAMSDKLNTIFYIEKYLRRDSDAYPEKINKDSVFRFLHSTNEWLELWQKDWLSESQKARNDAAYFCGKNNFRQAHQIIDNELLKNGSNLQLMAFKSEVYEEEGNTELALNEINKVLEKEPDNSIFLKQRAGYLNKLGKFSDAVNDLSRVLKKAPEDFDARYQRAGAAVGAQQLDLARADIQLYLKYFNTENAFFLAGQIYYASGNYLTALKYFNRIMDRKNPDVRYYRARGMTYYQTNTFDLAVYDLSMSLDLEPNNAEANLYLGLAEYYNGNTKSACYYWKRANNLGELKALNYLQKYCHE
jgi:tetratricopeptide (TPR) repeat protein